MGGEVGKWVGVGGTFGVGVGRKIREKTAHLFLNQPRRGGYQKHSAPRNWHAVRPSVRPSVCPSGANSLPKYKCRRAEPCITLKSMTRSRL